MRAPRILVLSHYPLRKPGHGGQIRLSALCQAVTACGCDIRTTAIYPDFQFGPEDRDPHDIVISDEDFSKAFWSDPLFGDVLAASFVIERRMLFEKLLNRVEVFSPDIIWLEQPFLYPVVEKLNSVLRTPVKVLYSSQNNELDLKKVLADLPSGPGVSDTRMFEATREAEQGCIAAADWVISINDREADQLRTAGKPVWYAQATSRIPFGEVTTGRFEALKRREKVAYLAYAASSYWLNIDGFFETFDTGLGFLDIDQKIWFAGGGGEALHRDVRFDRHRSINESRSHFHGFLPEPDLMDLYLSASAIIIPVTMGAGSNLKTADALASGRPVISTKKGLEGFRSLLGDALENGIYEAATPKDFRVLCRKAVDGDLKSPPSSLRDHFRQPALKRTIHRALIEMGILEDAKPNAAPKAVQQKMR